MDGVRLSTGHKEVCIRFSLYAYQLFRFGFHPFPTGRQMSVFRFTAAGLFIAATLGVQPADAALLASEGFDTYAAGADLNGNNGGMSFPPSDGRGDQHG